MSTTAGPQKLSADELDKLQRRLLGKALTVILSPEWGKAQPQSPQKRTTEEKE